MNVVFRVDASQKIGTGHLMRCLTLANSIKLAGASTCFVCRWLPLSLKDKLIEAGHELIQLAQPHSGGISIESQSNYLDWLGVTLECDALETVRAIRNIGCDWLVVDHYALNSQWEGVIAAHTRHILVIDDLADRPHDCSVLLDQTLGRAEGDYTELVSKNCEILVGPFYALLRPEFEQWRQFSLKRREKAKFQTLLITMGGVDQTNVTGWVLSALDQCALPEGFIVRVVMGSSAPHLSSIESQCASVGYSAEVFVDVNNMAELMANSDLAIGAAGTTSWERCCVGLPSVVLVLAENQRLIGASLVKDAGCVAASANSAEAISDSLIPIISELLHKPALLSQMSSQAASVTSGRGVERVVERVFQAA